MIGLFPFILCAYLERCFIARKAFCLEGLKQPHDTFGRTLRKALVSLIYAVGSHSNS